MAFSIVHNSSTEIIDRRKEVMRIGDDNLFEIGCRMLCFVPHPSHPHSATGVECPSIGNCNTISTRARVHHTVRLASYCVVGAGCLVVPTDDEMLDSYTVLYGLADGAAPDGVPAVERRTWSGRGRVQEADLRRKHTEYLREMLPKFNRLRRGDGA
jgi:dynactin-6